MVNFLWVGISVFLILMGIAISRLKWYWLISGYNTASKKEKENVDIEQVAKHMARMTYILAAIFLVIPPLLMKFKVSLIFFVLIILMVIIPYLIYLQRFDHNDKRGGKSEIVAVVVVIIITLAITSIPMLSSKIKVDVYNDRISITGVYGKTINYDEIKSIELVDEMPRAIQKVNGYNDFTDRKRGVFKLEGDVNATLFIENVQGPFIYITTNNSYIYINLKTNDETNELYKKISSNL